MSFCRQSQPLVDETPAFVTIEVEMPSVITEEDGENDGNDSSVKSDLKTSSMKKVVKVQMSKLRKRKSKFRSGGKGSGNPIVRQYMNPSRLVYR